MDKVFQALVVLGILIVASLMGSLLFTSFSITGLATDIETKFNEVNLRLDTINYSLWLESEEHYLEVMNKIDESVVEVIAYPPREKESDMSAVFYVDEEGNKWSLGTGFSVDGNGNILTAHHIVDGAEQVKIILRNGDIKEVESIQYASALDLSILYVKSGLPPVDILEEGNLEIGSTVGFIGFPLGNHIRTKTRGSISAVSAYRYNKTLNPVSIYVINSFINKGNSGGPVFSLKTGKVVGVINAVDIEKTGIGISTLINEKLFK